jgi:hypothetical protein
LNDAGSIALHRTRPQASIFRYSNPELNLEPAASIVAAAKVVRMITGVG